MSRGNGETEKCHVITLTRQRVAGGELLQNMGLAKDFTIRVCLRLVGLLRQNIFLF